MATDPLLKTVFGYVKSFSPGSHSVPRELYAQFYTLYINYPEHFNAKTHPFAYAAIAADYQAKQGRVVASESFSDTGRSSENVRDTQGGTATRVKATTLGDNTSTATGSEKQGVASVVVPEVIQAASEDAKDITLGTEGILSVFSQKLKVVTGQSMSLMISYHEVADNDDPSACQRGDHLH